MGMKKKNTEQNLNGAAAITEKDRKDHDGKRVITDERFAKVHSDPRFQKPPKHKGKVTIDSRFSAVFTDKRFATSSAPLDKRGKVKKGSSENALSRYYRMEEEDGGKVEEKKKKKKNCEVEKEDDEERRNGKAKIKEEESEESDSDSTDLESGDELKLFKSKGGDIEEETSEDDSVDGDSSEEEVDMESDATSSTTDSDEEGDPELEDDDSVEVENVPVVEKETHRLAIVNMDWSEVKATDLFVVLSSFLPKGGQILSVSVYPSEFGLKRMEEEAVRGPAALFDGEDENKGEDRSDDDDEIDNEKLRAYERSRLRYYYAVVVCDSVATADYLYKSCDGVEFERSSNVLDLRFIPDDLEFKHPPRDQATEAPAGYEGLDFLTQALQHSNVNLSWDEDEPHRVKTLKRKFNADQLADLELKEFLASDESESEEDGDDTEDPSERKIRKGDKYRALIQSGDGSEEEEDEQQDMEVTFNSGLEDISKKILERKDAKSETVWEKYLRNRKEKKARKNRKYSSDDESDSSDEASVEETNDFFEEEPQAEKTKKVNRGKKKRTETEPMETEKDGIASRAELELLVADDDKTENIVRGYKIKADKVKRKKGKKDAPAEDKLPTVDLDDPRFASLLNNPLFALDPTDPRFERTAAYFRQLSQQQRKGREELLNEELSNINKSGSALINKELSNINKSGSALINKQGKDEDVNLKSDKSTSKDKHELSMLVKSVKMKAKQVPLPTDNGKVGGSSGKKRKQDHSAKRKGNTGS